MASAPSRNLELGLSREGMEEMLMSLEMASTNEEFDYEYEKNGPGFLVAFVRDRKMFQKSFDGLVGKGCRPKILFRGLHCLLWSELGETWCQLPGRREIRSLEASLRKGVEDIRAFEKKYAEAHRLRVLSHCVSRQSAGRDEYELYFNRRSPLSQATSTCLTDNMLAYAEMLRSWWTPRSDAIKGYASIHNCVYAKVATGQPQFSIVSELNSSFLGRYIEPATLRKNLSRFERRNQKFYITLVAQLDEAHRLCRPVEPVNWPILFSGRVDKSK
jgi:hypothetical protein